MNPGMAPLNRSLDDFFTSDTLEYEPVSPVARSERAYHRQQLTYGGSESDAVSSMSDEVNETLDGMKLYHIIGQGGTSVVKLAKLPNKQLVAVKLLNDDLEEDVR